MATCIFALAPGQYCSVVPPAGQLRCSEHFGRRAAFEITPQEDWLTSAYTFGPSGSDTCGYTITRGLRRGTVCTRPKLAGESGCGHHLEGSDPQVYGSWHIYGPVGTWTEEIALTWLSSQVPEWGDESVRDIAEIAANSGHKQVFRWLLSHDYLRDREVFKLVLEGGDIELAEELRRAGLPVVLDEVYLTEMRWPQARRWAIDHMTSAELAGQDYGRILFRAGRPTSFFAWLNHVGEHDSLRRILACLPGRQIPLADQVLADQQVTYPRHLDDWPGPLRERGVLIRAVLVVALPPNMAHYVTAGL